MKYKLNIYNKFTFKTAINVLTICILSLLVLPIHAEEKTATTEAKAAAATVMNAMEATLNVSSQPEEVVVDIPADVSAAVEKKLLSKIEISKAEIDPAAEQVFRSPIYSVKPLLGYISIVDGEVLDLNYHGTSAVLSGYLKLIRDDFVLDSEQQANLLGKAFQHEFPYKRGEEFKQPVKLDKGWLLIRDEFFKNHSGLVFTTNEQGKITSVEYVLKINTEDYTYETPTEIIL